MDAAQLNKEELLDLVEQQEQRIAVLEQQLRLMVSKRYGNRSEKLSADQLLLFAQELMPDLPEQGEQEDTIKVTPHERKKRGKRAPCDEALEQKRFDYELPADQRQCECGNELTKIGEVSSKEYEIIPARYIVIHHVQHQYGCSCCQSGQSMKLAPKPASILPKTNAAPGLLAHITTTKFVDAVPLHRQEKQHERHGIQLPRNTMARWLMQLSDTILPLINLFEDTIREGSYTQCDETPMQVLKESGRKASSKSWLWVRRGGPPGKEVVLYNYFPSRSSAVVQCLFEECHGYVQCDGYSAYNVLKEQGIVIVGCMAHARRKYTDALKVLSGKESAQKTRAATAVGYIKQLYAIESRLRKSSATTEQRYHERQEKSLPILKRFKTWADNQTVLPKTPLGKALTYTKNQWEKLVRYCDDGQLEIDNNRDERAVRPVAIGRRNWLFADTPKGAHTNARFYSLIETCRLHGHEPYAYLKYIFKELPLVSNIDDFEALLPWNLDVNTVRLHANEV